jgi:hypothetical protein
MKKLVNLLVNFEKLIIDTKIDKDTIILFENNDITISFSDKDYGMKLRVKNIIYEIKIFNGWDDEYDYRRNLTIINSNIRLKYKIFKRYITNDIIRELQFKFEELIIISI